MSLSTEPWDIVVLTSAYPNKLNRYAGAFVRSKVELYRASGKRVLVLLVSDLDGGLIDGERFDRDDFEVVTSQRAVAILERIRYLKVFAHSLSPVTLLALKVSGLLQRAVLWFHGYEVRDPIRLSYNFTDESLEQNNTSRVKMLSAVKGFNQRRQLLREVFEDSSIEKVFVSEFLRTIASHDIGARPMSSHVIANPIDTDFYTPSESQNHRNVLFLRPFSAHNYGLDIMQDVISGFLARYADTHLRFFVRGDGVFHRKFTDKLKGLKAVDIQKGFLSKVDMKAMHSKCGTLLYPTRFDTQGVSMCEGLSSGMMVVANNVAAIPEYVSEDSSFLCRRDSIEDMICALRAIDLMSKSEFISRGQSGRLAILKKASVSEVLSREFELFLN